MVKKKAVSKKKKLTAKKPVKRALKAKIAVPKKPSRKTSIPAGASLEEVGVVAHYFQHVEAAVVKMTKGTLDTGDTIVIKGHTTDFKEKVASIQLDHVPIQTATEGQEIGLKVKQKVREHDVVYKIVG